MYYKGRLIQSFLAAEIDGFSYIIPSNRSEVDETVISYTVPKKLEESINEYVGEYINAEVYLSYIKNRNLHRLDRLDLEFVYYKTHEVLDVYERTTYLFSRIMKMCRLFSINYFLLCVIRRIV